MPLKTQLGLKTEATWGVPLTVDRFFEFDSEGVTPDVERWESRGLRSGQRGQRADRFVPYVFGYSGSIELDVLTKGFGAFLAHMLGSVSSTAVVDSTVTHTGAIATLCGKGLTMQVNRPLGACGDTDQAFTWAGGKVASWELSCEVGGVVKFQADLVFASGTTATALATAAYPTGAEPFPWGGVTVTVGGSTVPCTSFTVKCDNKLDTDRAKLRGNTARLEPVESDFREITVELGGVDFADLTTFYNRVTSSTAAGAVAAVVITCLGPTLAGATTYPAVILTMDAVRWDESNAAVEGPEIIDQAPSGKALVPASGTQLTVAYRTVDATP